MDEQYYDLQNVALSGAVSTEKIDNFKSWLTSSWPVPDEDFLKFLPYLETILRETIIDEIGNVISDAQEVNGNINNRGHVIALALFCAVDSISSYAYHDQRGIPCNGCGKPEKVGPRYKNYIKVFFPESYKKYADELYGSYRNASVHSWNLFKVNISSGNEPIEENNGILSFGLLNFYEALNQSLENFILKLKSDVELQNSCYIRYEKLVGYFGVIENKKSPIICNVPHSGIIVPEEFRSDFVLTQQDLEKEVLYMADNFTDHLYGELLYISSYIISKISRVVLDIERFHNEEDEPMSRVGMSALYTRTSSGELLRNIGDKNKSALEKIYKEYHDSFTKLVRDSLVKNDKAIIVDCHSFPSVPRVYEPEQDVNRPDICIGVDEYHTPIELVDILKSNFEKFGYKVGINTPFAGSIVPMDYYMKDKKVISVMIEVNRKLYMNEETCKKVENFSDISKDISRCIITSIGQFTK